jgi:hypothetical protein
MMGHLRRFVIAGGLLLSASSLAWSQSIGDLVQTAQQQSAEIQQLMSALQTSDPLTQYKLVEALLAHEDKALVRIGREHALFSTNPVMQNVAIVSALNENEFVEFVLSNPDTPAALKWVEIVGGAQDGTTGRVVMTTGKSDGTCWRVDRTVCHFSVVGTSVQFSLNSGRSGGDAQAVLQLGTDGVLRGRLTSNAGGAAVEIDLKE